jgi:hypothetical protein
VETTILNDLKASRKKKPKAQPKDASEQVNGETEKELKSKNIQADANTLAHFVVKFCCARNKPKKRYRKSTVAARKIDAAQLEMLTGTLQRIWVDIAIEQKNMKAVTALERWTLKNNLSMHKFAAERIARFKENEGYVED